MICSGIRLMFVARVDDAAFESQRSQLEEFVGNVEELKKE